MVLQLSDIRTKISERKNAGAISRAIMHQNRIRFHAQTNITSELTQPVSNFLAWVETLIPHDKFKIFKSLFRYPVITNEVTGICFDRLSKVFEGRNPAYNYQFKTSEQRDDWEWYRQEVLHEPTIWQTKGFEHFKTDINSILVCDMPVGDSQSLLPQPYFYWLSIEAVIDFKTNDDGRIEYLIFKQPEHRIAVFDDMYIRVFSTDKAENIDELLIERAHGLSYCPARFFMSEPISLADPDVKCSPITKELEALDWFLFFHTSKRHLDLYGAYPIYSGYEQSCDFSNAENGDYCDGGFLKNRSGQYKLDYAGLLCRCPKCGDKRIAGVGSFVEIPIPTENQPDLRNPVQMLTADVDSLKYNVDEENRLKENIINAVVGVNNEVVNNQALNERQIDATFESQSTILNRVKKGFEAAQQFVDETICRMRYGDMFVSAKINYGTEFYTISAPELRERYKTAKDGGASEAELDALQQQIIETEYRTNPTQLQRMLILAELEPYRHMSRQEVIDLHKDGLISDTELRLKLHFADYIRRFERENTNILEFGIEQKFAEKIKTILNTLKDYANENN